MRWTHSSWGALAGPPAPCLSDGHAAAPGRPARRSSRRRQAVIVRNRVGEGSCPLRGRRNHEPGDAGARLAREAPRGRARAPRADRHVSGVRCRCRARAAGGLALALTRVVNPDRLAREAHGRTRLTGNRRLRVAMRAALEFVFGEPLEHGGVTVGLDGNANAPDSAEEWADRPKFLSTGPVWPVGCVDLGQPFPAICDNARLWRPSGRVRSRRIPRRGWPQPSALTEPRGSSRSSLSAFSRPNAGIPKGSVHRAAVLRRGSRAPQRPRE